MKLLKETTGDEATNQMSLLSDTAEVIKFLEFAGEKSILNEHTITCRLTACNNLFSILDEGEDNIDYILNNLDLLVHRFRNRHAAVQPSTLKVYKSRVKGSLEDYRAWSKDPIAWEKSLHEKNKMNHKEKKNRTYPSPSAHRKTYVAESSEPIRERTLPSVRTSEGRRLSFPIRSDFNLEMVVPPEGLTLRELLRLGLFLYPYCKDTDNRDEQSAWAAALSFVKN